MGCDRGMDRISKRYNAISIQVKPHFPSDMYFEQQLPDSSQSRRQKRETYLTAF